MKTTSFLILFGVIAAMYLLPTAVAYLRNHVNMGAIAVTNVLLGWTFLGWVVALIWACTSNVRPPTIVKKTIQL